MKGKYTSGIMKVMIFVIDFWLINLAFIIARNSGLAYTLSADQFTTFFLIFGLIWIIAGFFNKIYRIDTTSLMRNVSINLFSTLLTHFLIIGTILMVFHIYRVGTGFLACVYILTAAFIVAFRLFYKLILKYYQFTGFDQRKVAIIGATGSGVALYQYFTDHETAGYHFSGFFDDDANPPRGLRNKIIGSLDAASIKSFCREQGIGEIYFALPLTHKELLKDISRFADDNFIYFRVAPDFSEVIHDTGDVFLINSVPVMTSRKEPLGISLNANVKRLFDIIFSFLVILIVFPIILPLVALAIRLNSRGPIFFKQLRPGKKNKLFDCYKFRTMRVNNTGELQATKNVRSGPPAQHDQPTGRVLQDNSEL
jgi:putative colanic acid biosynthesis UDP-glucose lipid carrier transferase